MTFTLAPPFMLGARMDTPEPNHYEPPPPAPALPTIFTASVEDGLGSTLLDSGQVRFAERDVLPHGGWVFMCV
jgi:hypothetical protein